MKNDGDDIYDLIDKSSNQTKTNYTLIIIMISVVIVLVISINLLFGSFKKDEYKFIEEQNIYNSPAFVENTQKQMPQYESEQVNNTNNENIFENLIQIKKKYLCWRSEEYVEVTYSVNANNNIIMAKINDKNHKVTLLRDFSKQHYYFSKNNIVWESQLGTTPINDYDLFNRETKWEFWLLEDEHNILLQWCDLE